MPPAGIPAARALPSKETTLFKEVLHHYEERQLKKGLKAADAILKKFPEHGETLCMKGLIVTHMGRRDEGLELVKLGIRKDITSHICWHVFGLIQKGQKNYEEALKSYTQALKFDRDNVNILRDAAHLQTQLRLYDGLVETRHSLLRLRPTLRGNWIGLVVAYHLNGNLAEAKNVLEHYERTLKNVPDYDVEQSETLLYHLRILEDLGEHTEALALLDASAKSRAIIDRVAIMEIRARLLLRLKHEDAEQAWQGLIEQNPDRLEYYKGFMSCQGIDLDNITDENRGPALQILRSFTKQLPKAAAPQRSALNLAVGDEFRELVEPYILSALAKGVPSLFADLKSLYADTTKRQVIEDLLEDLRTKSAHPPSEPCPTSTEPTTYLWALYFLAQHHSFLQRHQKALELLDEAVTHSPTLPELYMFRARVLKRSGDPFGAVRAMDQARELDLQDRFLNTKCGKYRLRAGLIEEASEIFGLFTKKDAPSPAADLEDMQSLMYLNEEADAQLRNGNFAMALKKYTAIMKVFDDFEDDQFDFHGYSLRKFTINIYLNMIQWEDTLRSHPSYVHAAIEASRILVRLHDDPSIVTAASHPALSGAEKKAKNKAKKAEKKVQEEAKKGASNEDKGLDATPPPKDEDPDGRKLIAAPEPLERAAKILRPLHTLATDNLSSWIAIYDVALRRKKWLQAAQALTRAHALNAEHPELHLRVLEFRRHWTDLSDKPAEPVGPLVSKSLSQLVPDEVSLEAYNSQYLQRHSTDAEAILASAKASRAIGAAREEVESSLFAALNEGVELRLQTALSVISFLKEIGSPREEEFRDACSKRFDHSTLFKPATELVSLRKAATQRETPNAESGKEEFNPTP